MVTEPIRDALIGEESRLGIAEVLRGDHIQFSHIVAAWEPRLRLLLSHNARAAGRIDAILRRSIVVAYFRLSEFPFQISCKHWLGDVVRRAFTDWQRRKQNKCPVFFLIASYDTAISVRDSTDILNPTIRKCTWDEVWFCLNCFPSYVVRMVDSINIRRITVGDMAFRFWCLASGINQTIRQASQAVKRHLKRQERFQSGDDLSRNIRFPASARDVARICQFVANRIARFKS